ncbi:hypothetical protein KIN20_024185 [Parelaphostrongylus tenuis]|uniref:Uncharacterized protein n=1 Tax=Parelaphostrongylus tenuis TaxID=148309 RepID=A0AAD5N7Y0_PARTN|nr:hypothetical protein KIN20_024185 [Parelaphostrongylus tenuis]
MLAQLLIHQRAFLATKSEEGKFHGYNESLKSVCSPLYRNSTGAKGFIRGCYSSLFLVGFNRTGSVGALAAHAFCHTFNLTQLLSRGRPQESSMRVGFELGVQKQLRFQTVLDLQLCN